MNASYIAEQVEKECIKKGCSRSSARNAGMKVADDWKKNKYTIKLSKVMENTVTSAVKRIGEAPTRHYMKHRNQNGYTRIRQTRTLIIVEWME